MKNLRKAPIEDGVLTFSGDREAAVILQAAE
jgi:hypothetical protein